MGVIFLLSVTEVKLGSLFIFIIWYSFFSYVAISMFNIGLVYLPKSHMIISDFVLDFLSEMYNCNHIEKDIIIACCFLLQFSLVFSSNQFSVLDMIFGVYEQF